MLFPGQLYGKVAFLHATMLEHTPSEGDLSSSKELSDAYALFNGGGHMSMMPSRTDN